MSILFAGGELTDFDPGSSVYDISTNGADLTYSRGALRVYYSSQYLVKNLPTQNDLWVRMRYQIPTTSNTAGRVMFKFTSDADVFRIVGSGTAGVASVERWDGAAWQLMTTFNYTSTTYSFTMRAVIGIQGLFQVYLDEALIAEYTGDTSALGSITQFTISGLTSNFFAISEVIAATHDIRSARLKTLAITGPGAVNEWAGAYTDVNAASSPDDSFLASDTAEQKVLFAKNGLAADTFNVDAVVISGRFRQNATGPSNIDALMRVDGVDYGKNVGDLGDAFAHHQVIFAVNPATAAPWTREAAEAAQIGLQSKA